MRSAIRDPNKPRIIIKNDQGETTYRFIITAAVNKSK
jgi:hypothetical protein